MKIMSRLLQKYRILIAVLIVLLLAGYVPQEVAAADGKITVHKFYRKTNVEKKDKDDPGYTDAEKAIDKTLDTSRHTGAEITDADAYRTLGTPLDGAGFTLYQVDTATLNTALKNGNGYSSHTVAADNSSVTFTLDGEGEPAVTSITAAASALGSEKITAGGGEASWTGLADGYYILAETKTPDAGYEAAATSLIRLPLTKADGTAHNRDIHVYPKNVGDLASVTKEVEGEKIVYGLEEDITWVVDYYIGPGMRVETAEGSKKYDYAKNFSLFDEMDSRLDYLPGTVSFVLQDIDRKTLSLNLIPGTDYNESYDGNTHIVTWYFTDAGVEKIANNQVKHVLATLVTSINESAYGTADTSMWNNAKISFTNASGDPYEMEVFDPDQGTQGENVPKIWTGSITIEKVAAKDKSVKLAGAKFKVAASEADAKAGKFLQRGGKDLEVTTDKNGLAVVDVVGAGTYYLVETTAPEGYKLVTTPLKVVIENDQENRLISVQITNEKVDATTPTETKPPGTKGTSAKSSVKTGDIIRIAGLVLMLGGALGFILAVLAKRRKQAAT